MKGFVSGVMNVFFFPLKLFGKTVGFLSKEFTFIRTQLNNDKQLKKNIGSFYRNKKKNRHLNDELI